MSLTTESAQIKIILDSIEVDGSTVFQEVLTAPPNDDNSFDGYPSAYFAYDTTESDYATNTQNRRTHSWAIFVESFTQSLNNEQNYAKIYKIVDTLIQTFDENDDLNGSCDFLIPTPGQLMRYDTPSGVGLIAEVRLRCWTDVDVRNA